MLVAVTAFFGYFKHLHIGAEQHIVSRFHSSLGKQGDKILFLMLFDKRAQVIRTNPQLVADSR